MIRARLGIASFLVLTACADSIHASEKIWDPILGEMQWMPSEGNKVTILIDTDVNGVVEIKAIVECPDGKPEKDRCEVLETWQDSDQDGRFDIRYRLELGARQEGELLNDTGWEKIYEPSRTMAHLVEAWGISSRFHGDGVFTDRGFFSFMPRYRIVFERVPLSQSAGFEFSFGGAPPALNADVLLRVADYEGFGPSSERIEGKYDEHWAALRDANPRIEVELTDTADGVVCRASGNLTQNWVAYGKGIVNRREMTWAFWQDPCIRLRLNSSSTYHLKVQVSTPATSTNVVQLIPVIEWGGLDAP